MCVNIFLVLLAVSLMLTFSVYLFIYNRIINYELQKSVKMPKIIMKEKPSLSWGDNWTFYRDSSGKYRWRRVSTNQNVVGASTQGYVNKKDCVSNAIRNGYNGNKTNRT